MIQVINRLVAGRLTLAMHQRPPSASHGNVRAITDSSHDSAGRASSPEGLGSASPLDDVSNQPSLMRLLPMSTATRGEWSGMASRSPQPSPNGRGNR